MDQLESFVIVFWKYFSIEYVKIDINEYNDYKFYNSEDISEMKSRLEILLTSKSCRIEYKILYDNKKSSSEKFWMFQ